ncbi:restriction endonuclease subunit S [Yersinia enterocolitica]
MSVEKKVPEIRFKGFGGEWDYLTLGENATFTKGQGYSKGDLVTSGSPIILYGRLYTKYQTVITGVDTFVTEKDNSVKSIGGEVIVPASGESPEDISRASVVSEPNVILGGDLNIVLPRKKIHSTFLALAISNGRLKKKLSSKAQGKSVVHIRNSDLADLDLILPTEYIEQTAIGNYFQKLDSLIKQHQQKHDKLSNIKKTMLEKMFPKQGETIPEIRFKGFSGEWVENNLGELIDIRSAARVHKEQWTEAGVPFFRTSDVVSIYKGQENTKAYISHEIYHGLSEKIGKVTKDDLLITGGGSIGIPYLVPNDSPLYFKDADLLWLKNNEKFNGYFLYTFFFSVSFKQHIKSISHTGTIAHYTIEQAKATPINTCSDEEQTAIGNYFQKLDALINQHQQQISKLNNIKQACLSKMFV